MTGRRGLEEPLRCALNVSNHMYSIVDFHITQYDYRSVIYSMLTHLISYVVASNLICSDAETPRS